VGAPEVLDHTHPRNFGLGPFEPPTGLRTENKQVSSTTPPPPLPALRALRPPLRAEVRVTGGKPSFVRSAAAQGDVVTVAGPWRTTGYWWSEEERFALDHFDLQISDGSVIRLCYDWVKRTWQIDGIYD
jgi:protein ImuB